MSYTRTRDQRIADEVTEGIGPCLVCGKLSLKTMLSQYGARCLTCYEDYCAQGVRGGAKGFLDGLADTPEQRQMRKRIEAFAVRVKLPIGDAETLLRRAA